MTTKKEFGKWCDSKTFMTNTNAKTGATLSEANTLIDILSKLRANAAFCLPTLDEITKEVEAVRTKRYAKNKA